MSSTPSLILMCSCFYIMVVAVPFEITMYSDPGHQSGQRITMNQTNMDFECASAAIGGIRSHCSVGSWVLKTKNIPGGYDEGWFNTGTGNGMYCYNMNSGWDNVVSLSRVGPADTSTPAVTFKNNPDTIIVIEKVAEAFLNLPNYGGHLTLTFTGTSSWTFFEQTNFEGKSICWRSTKEIESRGTSLGFFAPSNIKSFGSVLRGCDLSAAEIQNFKVQL